MTCSMRSWAAEIFSRHKRDERGRSGDAIGEVVDVDVGTLQFTQDRVEFGECVGVSGGGRRPWWSVLLVGADRGACRSVVVCVTVLVITPSATAVVIWGDDVVDGANHVAVGCVG